jgi:3-isopropylmalate/(R)-2-methylmalate dehydratase small subunit
VATPDGTSLDFEIDAFRKDCLLRSLDDIELTLEHEADIRTYEKHRHRNEPWIFE